MKTLVQKAFQRKDKAKTFNLVQFVELVLPSILLLISTPFVFY